MRNRPVEDLKALDRLVDSQVFQELDSYVSPFSLLGSLNLARDELTHSRLLAALFDPRENQQAPHVLLNFLRAVADELHRAEANEKVANGITSLEVSDLRQVTTYCERESIDVVVEIDGRMPVLIGIENKIDAGEQPGQIERYQTTVAQRCVKRTGVVVFLTPTGRSSNTANPKSPIPYVPLSYEVIVDAAETAQQQAPSQHDATATGELVRHLREEILEKSSVRDRARSIWKDHSRALRVLLDHKPALRDIREQYANKVRHRFGDDVEVWDYPPTRSDISEIKFRFPSWRKRGCDLVFMLHTRRLGDAEGRPRFRLLVTNDWYRKNSDVLDTLARNVNQATVDLQLDEQFERLRGWPHWRRVLKDDDLYPERAALGEVVIPGDTDTEAVERAIELVETLRPFIEALPER